jgi:DNA replication and repair protein RecF
LLKEIGDSRTGERRARELLRPWNDTLSTAAAAVVAARREFALDLDSRARNVPEKLLPECADVRVAYRPSPGYDSGAREGYEAALRSRLAARVADEIRLGYTVAGPQRDELSLTVAGKDLLIYGSSGQQRAALIALLLAQMELTRERKGAYPVLLLDDVDSDIDEARIATLLDGLGESFQAVVATSKGSLPGADARLRLTMKNGRAERGSPTRGSAEV